MPRIASLLLLPLLLSAPLGACGGAEEFRCDLPGAYPAGVLWGPHVDLPSPTGVTIAWRSTTPVTGSVRWGHDAGFGFVSQESGEDTAHAVRLEGLEAATTYRYRILQDGQPAGGDHVFRTPPSDVAAAVRFVVIGDSGTGCAEEYEAVATLAAQDPDFVLHTGDAAYSSGTPEEVHSRFVVPFAPVRESTPVFVTLGNHDAATDGGAPLLDAVLLPANSADGSSRFYSFDWGPCHVACLDSNGDLSPSGVQHAWLDADLAASGATWKLVFFHHPVHSSSRHGSTPGLAESLGPLFDEHGVDVVFCGHDHDYERTFPLVAGKPDPGGTVYVVTGGGGAALYPSGTSELTAWSEAAHHVTRVDVDAGVLSITAIRTDGTVLDHATVTR